MSFEEYTKKMSEYAKQLHNCYDGKTYDMLYEEVSQFQSKYMEEVLTEYQKKIDCKAREIIYELLCYAVRKSKSGSSITDVETKEVADAIDEIIWEEIGDYLLDYEIYKEDNHFVVDCIFAGICIPYWDGWQED